MRTFQNAKRILGLSSALVIAVSCSPKASILKGSAMDKSGGTHHFWQLAESSQGVPLCALVVSYSLSAPMEISGLSLLPDGTVSFQEQTLGLKRNKVLVVMNDTSGELIQSYMDLSEFSVFISNGDFQYEALRAALIE